MENADTLVSDVEARVRANDVAGAMALARQAIAGGVRHPMLLNLRAYSYELEGRDDLARADLEQAVKLAPEDALVRNAYGLILAKLERRQEAVAAFETAVKLAPEFPPAHYNLGWAREATGDLAAAQVSLEKALTLKPDYPEPLARLAALAFRRSDFAAAHEFAERALALNPAHPLALTTLANLAVAEGMHDEAEAIMARLLAAPNLQPMERALATGVLGDLRHSQGRYADAFAAYRDSNQQKYRIYAPRFDAPGAETVATYAGWLANYFEKAPAKLWKARTDGRPPGSDEPRCHVFLVGFPRSGTTLLENVLASHPDVVSLEEKGTLDDATRAFLNNAAGRDRLGSLSGPDAAAHRSHYWRRVREFGAEPAGKVFIDKHPLNSIKLPIVAKLFPQAKILFALRDPRDVVLSCFRRTFVMNPSMFEFTSLERTARFYHLVMRLSAAYREKFEMEWLETRHEDLIDNFDGETKRVCDFLGLPWTTELSAFAERARERAIATPSSVQVARGLNRSGLGAWRHYHEQMAPILPVLSPWVKMFGYEAE
jgi:Tfp pilus assembly protein PilF